MKPIPTDLDGLCGQIHGNIARACDLLYRIDHRDGSGLHAATLWPHQQRMFDTMLEQRRTDAPARIVCLKTRRAGTSTASAIWNFHHFYWRPRQHALTVAHHDTTTAVIYQIYKLLYSELPPELQRPLTKLNRKELSCEPPWGSNLIAQTAGYLDIGRGMTIQHAHLSEIDYWPDPETALDGILNTVHWHPDTSIIVESTANGADGWLHHFWRETLKGKTGFAPLFQAWYDVPEHASRVPATFEFNAQDREWMKAFGLLPTQIYWYRRKEMETIAKEPWGGERKMRQEYPFTAEEAFQSSGFCVFPDTVLAQQRDYVLPPKHVAHLRPIAPGEFHAEPADWVDNTLAIWKDPEPGRYYSLGVDVSDGVGQTESVVSICAYPGYEQVAEWASKISSVEETAWVSRWLAQKYGGSNCLIIPEINKSGVLVVHLLSNLPGDFSLYRWTTFDRAALYSSVDPKLGWETNDGTKKILIQVANMIFLGGAGMIHSAQLHEQMRRCIDVMPGRRWRVEGGASDRVLAWLISMIGAFVEFQGGNLDTLKSPITSQKAGPQRERNSYDADYEDDFHDIPRVGGGYLRSDYE